MSLSTGSRRISAESLASAALTAAADIVAPREGEIDGTVSAPVAKGAQRRGVSGKRAKRMNDAWPSDTAGSGSDAHQRRRLTAPLLDFVSALRGAISAFGQGEVGSRRELTLRQVTEVTPLLGYSLERSPGDATRILYIGDLSPHSGVVDLLSCIIQWAERHPGTPVDICWAGSGDLQGVLRAQSKPPNLSQSFTPSSDPGTLAALAAERGILAVPNAGTADLLPMAQAMAAGLPVLGSVRCPEVRLLVTSAATGWLFDPLSSAEMSGALDAALSTSQARLAEMRAAARRRLNSLCEEWLGSDYESTLRVNTAQFASTGQA